MNKEHIRNALADIPTGTLVQTAKALLATLGYRSERNLELSGTVDDFIENFPTRGQEDKKEPTKTEQTFRNTVESIYVVFQITENEVNPQAQQTVDFAEKSLAESFCFFAADLKEKPTSRSRYAELTREINKRLSIPAVALFRTGNRLTIGFAGRRQHRRKSGLDVIERVTLIKDIRLENPHRAHLDILAELALGECLQWMDAHKKQRNFDGLLDTWFAKLDTEELNKQFYRRLFAWFEWAISEATFPKNEKKILKPEEHVIRFITRILFIWFLKEQGLVADALFNQTQIPSLLKDDDFDNGSSYYRAVLQNLFFATLNTEITRRGFSSNTPTGHRDFSRYRYAAEIRAPEKLLELFAQTPFVNGGLFECLDSEEAAMHGGYRIDCFSDKHGKKLCFPNRLFFDKHRGLFPLLNHYKFTIEENTPVEQEVALEPELLGKVFENLLAAYNPETGTTARKGTGSYYTPRVIVDYMIDEIVVATLVEKCQPSDGDATLWEERLRYLLDYGQTFDDANEWFDAPETDAIVRTISELKILEPAVGSGAFPRAMLRKLTLALRRLDSANQRWQQLQRRRAAQRAEDAFETDDDEARREELIEIDETFRRYRDSDFGRKLYLIQNNLFGVDIQPIACQITKLRFFISLAIEQKPARHLDNFGFKPLPNLETRFLAANTLVGLQGQPELVTVHVQALERQLRENRERHFHATTRQQKLDCISNDKAIRTELAAALEELGFSARNAENIAHWNPYEQNENADWFEPEWMFGINDGFDIVMGNPPYISVTKIPAPLRDYLFENYQTCIRRTDIYIAFLERALSILQPNGMMCFILSSAFAKQKYGEKMRRRLIENHAIRDIVDASRYRIFENAAVHNIVLLVGNQKTDVETQIRLHTSNADFETPGECAFSIKQDVFAELKDARLETAPNIRESLRVKKRIWERAVRFDKICLVAYGARLNSPSAGKRKQDYISEARLAGRKRFCEGRDIRRYTFSQTGWLRYSPNEHYNPMFPELFETEKLMFTCIVNERLRFAYDAERFYNSHTVINCVRLDLLSGASHITARRATQSADNKFAKRYDYKFLLGVLNSGVTNWYFRSFLSTGLNCYPDDVKELPIPKMSRQQQQPIIGLTSQILAAKAEDSEADVSALEAEIDRLLCAFYKLTAEEMSILEHGRG